MNSRTLIYFGLGLVCIIIALVIFYTKFFTFMAFLFLILGAAGVLLFRQGMAEMKKKKE
jgi:predicted membrane channel-forming protein YqfA (hemolysin III family)